MAKAKEPSKAKETKAKEPSKARETKEESKFARFLTERKLDARRVLIASRNIEALRPEDRAIKLNKRRAASAGDSAAQGAEKETRKPRSGRPVTRRALQAALLGGQLSGPTKTRLLRAVNHILGQKKQDLADLRALF